MLHQILTDICTFLNTALNGECTFFEEYRSGYEEIPPKNTLGAVYLKEASLKGSAFGIHTDAYSGNTNASSEIEFTFSIELSCSKSADTGELNNIFLKVAEALIFFPESPIKPRSIHCSETTVDTRSISYRKLINIGAIALLTQTYEE